MISILQKLDDQFGQSEANVIERPAVDYPIPVNIQYNNDPVSFARIFLSRMKLIGAAVIGAALLALIFIWLTTPLYSSTTELLIDPRQKRTIDAEVSPSGLGTSAVGGDTLLLDSQIEVLNSQSVIDRLIHDEQLTEDNEFARKSAPGAILFLKNMVKLVVYGPHSGSRQSASIYDKTIRTLRKRLSIKRVRNTYVIAINVLTSNADKSARIANSVANIYIEETNSAASLITSEVATNLDRRLLELSSEVHKSETRVEVYRTKNGLIGTKNGLTVEQQLRALTDRLSRAKADSQSQLAIFNQVKAAGVLGDPSTATGTVTSSQVMSNLQTTLATLDSDEADFRSTYLPNHPKLKRLQERKEAVRKSISREFDRIVRRLEVKYKSALETVNSLAREVSLLERGVANSNSATLKLRQLEREAEANRNVYKSFLTRSKEAAEQVGLPSSTARIISIAYPASQPAYPRSLAILAAAIVFGLIAGITLAWTGHIFGEQSVKYREQEQRIDH